MEIEKSYFTLPEILERWSMAEADLVYLAENDQLRLSIRVFNLGVEFGDYEETPNVGGKPLDAALKISYILRGIWRTACDRSRSISTYSR